MADTDPTASSAEPGPPASGPAIPLVDFADLPPALALALRPRVDRLGYLGDFFRAAAHQPQALLAFNELTETLKAAVSDELAELVALRVASRLTNLYERNQHEQLAYRQGRSRAWIAAAEQRPGSSRAAFGSAAELAIDTLLDALLDDAGHGANAAVRATVAELGAADAMAVLLLAGRYVAHALVANALELAPPVPPVLADGAPA